MANTNFLVTSLQYLTQLIYPNTCAVCNKVCNAPICNNCMHKIRKKMLNERKIYLQTKERFIDEHIYLFRYKGEIQELITKYKFKEKSYLYKAFSYLIQNNEKIIRIIKKYDYIIPIPIHSKRKKYRGYNQSELIIRDLCKNKNTIKYYNKILVKTKNIKPQSSLNKEERYKNIQGAYEINQNAKQLTTGKAILLFDDIYTTGSTANEAGKILKQNGAEKVGILTIAKD